MIAYFLAGQNGTTYADLCERGLGHAFEKGAPITASPGFEVGGERGVVVVQSQDVSPSSLSSIQWQSMEEITGDDRHRGVSIGLVGSGIPEQWLRRRSFCGGEPLTVRGGCLYVPVLSRVPGVVVMRAGQLVPMVREPNAIEAHRMIAEALANADGAGGFSLDGWRFMELMLGINYRATWAEWTVLECLMQSDGKRVLDIATDVAGQAATAAGRNPTMP
jgi:hypothetical protein